MSEGGDEAPGGFDPDPLAFRYPPRSEGCPTEPCYFKLLA